MIKVTKFNCRKKLVSVTKLNENNPTGHQAKIFFEYAVKKAYISSKSCENKGTVKASA